MIFVWCYFLRYFYFRPLPKSSLSFGQKFELFGRWSWISWPELPSCFEILTKFSFFGQCSAKAELILRIKVALKKWLFKIFCENQKCYSSAIENCWPNRWSAVFLCQGQLEIGNSAKIYWKCHSDQYSGHLVWVLLSSCFQKLLVLRYFRFSDLSNSDFLKNGNFWRNECSCLGSFM